MIAAADPHDLPVGRWNGARKALRIVAKYADAGNFFADGPRAASCVADRSAGSCGSLCEC